MKKYIYLFLLIFVFGFSVVSAKLFSIKTECPFKTEGLSTSSEDYDNGEIHQLQFLLSLDKDIYPEGLVTGKYGELTKKAVERFQGKNSLEKTGIVDSVTQEKLCE
ncbi:MAG: peptidoglycan-binding domain-containing protein [Candidatus Pacebacteria bacterium]|nr:peptidoglycan-binding domain-containing protein [Candidatus Paceibacterota bacterium]